jgi:EAL domain-containing protein (putative c-di-GMP-specific phosphodiesterase class I)
VNLFGGKGSALAKALGTALMLIAAVRVGIMLAAPANQYALLWPVGGVALLCVYYWKWPALVGVLLGSLVYNATTVDWRWFSLLDAAHTTKFAFADAATLAVICLASVVQAWLSARVLRVSMPALRDGSLPLSGWLWMLLLAGPLACLLKTAMLALALGWITVPLRTENLVFASAMWVSTTLAIWMAVPLIIIRELRADLPNLARDRLRNPWVALALVAVPAWGLAAYVGGQQAQREQQRLHELGAAFRGEVQVGLDLAAQKLAALRAYYRATGTVSQDRFAQFADELLEGTPLLIGLNWAGRVADDERAQVEAELAAEQGHAVPLSQLDGEGHLVPAPRRDEYWPLLRMAPDARKAILGFDLASEPNRRKAMLAAQQGGVTVSSRAMSAHADNDGHVPAVFLYLATANPRGVVVAPLKIDSLLGEEELGRQLLAQGHGLVLSNAAGEVLASMEQRAGTLGGADPGQAQQFELKVGAQSWRLEVTTAKVALPYLTAPLWWFGQTLPQLLCALVGLFFAMLASSDRQLFQLERHYAGYVESHVRKAAPRALSAARFDAAIEAAWEARAFEPQFEPIVDIGSGDIRGIEALLRWRGAPDGVDTSAIIDWAERRNLIAELDHDMLVATLRAAADWPLARLPGFTVSVNVSASDMQHPHWAERILRELARQRVGGRNLCVEITEGVLLRSDDDLLGQLAALRAAGVRIALDDFGTGYSSIAYLHQLPVDRIKLDSTFVSNLADDDKARRIVASIVTLGHTLDIDLVAEAVEDARTVRVLQTLGCRLAQGRYYSAAVDGRVMRDLLSRQIGIQRARA